MGINFFFVLFFWKFNLFLNWTQIKSPPPTQAYLIMFRFLILNVWNDSIARFYNLPTA